MPFEGSAVAVLGDVVAQGELERQSALFKGDLQVAGYMNEAKMQEYRQKVYRDQANQSFRYYGQSPLAAAGISVLGSAASSYGSYASSGIGAGSAAPAASTGTGSGVYGGGGPL